MGRRRVEILECPSWKHPWESLIHSLCVEHLLWSTPVQALEKDSGSALLPGSKQQCADRVRGWGRLSGGGDSQCKGPEVRINFEGQEVCVWPARGAVVRERGGFCKALWATVRTFTV